MNLDIYADKPVPRAKSKSRATSKNSDPTEKSADTHLRASKLNAALLTASIKASKRGQLITFDPRKK